MSQHQILVISTYMHEQMPLLNDHANIFSKTRGLNLVLAFIQGCGNIMPDLSTLVPFHSGQVKNFYLLVLGQVQCIKLIQFCIAYFDQLLLAHSLH